MRKTTATLLVFAVASLIAFGVTRASLTNSEIAEDEPPSASGQPVGSPAIRGALTGTVTPSTSAVLDHTDDDSTSTGFFISYLTILSELHERMVLEGLALVDVTVTGTGVEGDIPTLDLTVNHVVWAPTGATVPESRERTTTWRADPNRAVSFDLPTTALAVIDAEGEILGLAVPGLDVDGLRLEVQVDPLFLTIAAEELMQSKYGPIPQDRCLPDRTRPTGARQALITYFAVLGDQSVGQRQAANERLVDAANDLVDSNSFLIDAVIGWVLAPASQDIYDQLRSGIATQDVVIRPAIPIGITVPTVPVDEDAIVVFVAQPSNRVLGFTVLSPHFSYDEEGNATPLFDTVLELSPPEEGDDLAVYIRSVEDRFACPASSEEVALLSIPYDDYAGTGRVALDLATQSYKRVTALRVAEV